LTRIFNHGFTTRADGHGFGLHSSALAAKEMGGSLTAQSAGPGQARSSPWNYRVRRRTTDTNNLLLESAFRADPGNTGRG